jgi:hypothetical protein
MKNPIIPLGSESSMEMKDDEFEKKDTRPACFGDEAKFVAYMENQATDSECARCMSENDCGEYILLKCSRETIF